MNQNERYLIADYGNTSDELLALIQKKYDTGSACSRIDHAMIYQSVEVARQRCEAAEMALEMFRAGTLAPDCPRTLRKTELPLHTSFCSPHPSDAIGMADNYP